MAVCSVHFRRRSWFERNGARLLTLVAFGALAVLAAVLRFWQLDLRTFHDDESLYALVARQFARTAMYEHVPELHGPLHVMLTAGVFRAFGDGDAAARIMPAIFGVALGALPFAFANKIGRPGAIAAALLLAVSPTMIYFSRFAGPDIELAFFTLATAIALWRYLDSGERPWIYVMAATLAFAVTSSEMALAIVPIFAAYLAYRVAGDLFEQAGEPRIDTNVPKTHYERLGLANDAQPREIRRAYKAAIERTEVRAERETLANSYHVLTAPARREAYDRKLARRTIEASNEADAVTVAGAGTYALLIVTAPLIALMWPFAGAVKRRLNLRSLPVAANALVAVVLLMLPFYGPLVEKLSFVGDRGFDGQQTIVVIGGSNINPGGELPVMLATLGVIFAITTLLGFAWKWHAWIVCAAIFYGIAITLFTGFFTHKGGVWTGLWGTLDYTWRPEAHHANGPIYYYGMMLGTYEFLALGAIGCGLVALIVFSGWRNRVTVAATSLALVAVAFIPGWAPIDGHQQPLIATAIVGAAILSLRLPDVTKFLAFWCAAAFCAFSMIGRKDPWLTVHVALPAIMLSAKIVNDAVAAFEMPQIALPQFRVYAPRRLAQGLVAAAFAAVAVFTLRSGVLAGWGHGDVPQLANSLSPRDHGDTPIELLSSTQNAPDVRELSRAIDRAAAASGRGRDMAIVLDSSFDFSKGWGWYLRDYPNLSVEDLRKPYVAPADAIVLMDSRNRANVSGIDASLAVTFTKRWGFPDRVDGLSRDDLASRLVSAGSWSNWYGYLANRASIGQPPYVEGVAEFPRELSASIRLARQSDVLSTNVGPVAAVTPAASGPVEPPAIPPGQ